MYVCRWFWWRATEWNSASIHFLQVAHVRHCPVLVPVGKPSCLCMYVCMGSTMNCYVYVCMYVCMCGRMWTSMRTGCTTTMWRHWFSLPRESRPPPSRTPSMRPFSAASVHTYIHTYYHTDTTWNGLWSYIHTYMYAFVQERYIHTVY